MPIVCNYYSIMFYLKAKGNHHNSWLMSDGYPSLHLHHKPKESRLPWIERQEQRKITKQLKNSKYRIELCLFNAVKCSQN